MTIISEESLARHQFWSGAATNASMLKYSELELLDSMLTDLYPEGIDETTLNDIMWFDFDWVCELLGTNEDYIIERSMEDGTES